MIRFLKKKRSEKMMGIPLGIHLTNFFFQKILRIDAKCAFSKHFTSRIMCPEKIVIENNSKSVLKSFAVSGGGYFQACQGIYIGEGTVFAHGVSMVTIEHDLDKINAIGKAGQITIGKKCWLGAKATIVSGIELGDNTIVGANSVVTKSFPDGYVVIGGVPAKVIRRLPLPNEAK